MKNALDIRRMRRGRFFRQQYMPKKMQSLPVPHIVPQYRIRSFCQIPQHLLSICFSIHSTHLQTAGGLPAIEGFAICPGIPLEVIVLIQHQRLPLTYKSEHAAIGPRQSASTTTMQPSSSINRRKIRQYSQVPHISFFLDVCRYPPGSYQECCTILHSNCNSFE